MYVKNLDFRQAHNSLDIGEAHNQVEKRLAEETDRTANYLSPTTQSQLLALVTAKLLTPHLTAILQMPGTGLRPMLEQDRHSDLRRLYALFLRVPDDVGRQALRLALRSDIEERGRGINEGESQRAGPSSVGQDEGEEDEDMAGKGKGKGKEKAGAGAAGANALSLALRWVQDVLDLKDKFDRILEEAFSGDKSVQMSINEVSRPRIPG